MEQKFDNAKGKVEPEEMEILVQKCFTKHFAETIQLFRIWTDPLDFSKPFRIEIEYNPEEPRTTIKCQMPKASLSQYIEKEMGEELAAHFLAKKKEERPKEQSASGEERGIETISYVENHYKERIKSSERVRWVTILKNQGTFFRLLYGIEGLRCLSGADWFRAEIDYDETAPEYTIRFTNYRKDGTEIPGGSQTYSFAIKELEFRLVYGIDALCSRAEKNKFRAIVNYDTNAEYFVVQIF